MATVSIQLRDGFADDTVAVSCEGRELARREHVRTDLRISYAGAVEVALPPGPAALEIAVPTQGLTARLDLHPAATPFVTVDVLDGRLAAEAAREPARFL